MKKTLFLPVLLLLLCCVCGALALVPSPDHVHFAWCTDPETCVICGKTTAEGVRISYVDHREFNAETGACKNCDYVCTDHVYAWKWYDENVDYYTCTVCGHVAYGAEHYASCANPGVCVQCGQEIAGLEVRHNYGYVPVDENYHLYKCLDCGEGEQNTYSHWADCDHLGVCNRCGAEYHGNNIQHHVADWDEWLSDETSHWHVCDRCGEVYDKNDHYTGCTEADQTVCHACKTAHENMRLDHWNVDYSVRLYDETGHWYLCNGCGQAANKEAHNTDSETGKCWGCDFVCPNHVFGEKIVVKEASGHDNGFKARVCQTCGGYKNRETIEAPDHVYAWRWSDERYDQYYCTVCDYVKQWSDHYASCANPGVCVHCGLEKADLEVRHNYGYVPLDEDCHIYKCMDCEEAEQYTYIHWAYCDQLGVCRLCGAEYHGNNIDHYMDDWDAWQSDETSHWRVCDRCGEIFDKGVHFTWCTDADQTVCHVCKTAHENMQLDHWNFDDSDRRYDETGHWYQCKSCGQEARKEPHHVDSQTGECWGCDFVCPNHVFGEKILVKEASGHENGLIARVCQTCGGYKDEEVIEAPDHVFAWRRYNDYADQYYCTICGYVKEWTDHYASCANPGVCVHCGLKRADLEVRHNYADVPLDENYHVYRCIDCDEAEQYTNPHWADCDNPGVCGACGAEYHGDRVSHFVDRWDVWEANGAGHWHICDRCGEKVDYSQHASYCTEPGICFECGAEYAGGRIKHIDVNWENYESDGVHHWNTCMACGEKAYINRHYARCTTPGVCVECGAKTPSTNLNHNYEDYEYQYNELCHWHVCKDCGQAIYRNSHRASCINPGVCSECGAPYTGDTVTHNVNWQDKHFDADSHWNVCKDCGQKVYESEHYALCDLPGVCDECGAPYTGEHVIHAGGWEDMRFDEKEHWELCELCGEEVYRGEHEASCQRPGICADCGAPYTGENVQHNAAWDFPKNDAEDHWYLCLDCGEICYKTAHAFEEGSTVCIVCGYQCQNHVWGESEETKAATCTEAGTAVRACTICGTKETLSIAALGHTEIKMQTLAPTCDTAGQTVVKCSVCGANLRDEVIPALGHTEEELKAVAATCEEAGLTAGVKCSVCEKILTEQQAVPALGHDWDEGEVTTKATCEAAGVKTFTCKNDATHTRTEAIPALGHTEEELKSVAATCEETGLTAGVKCSECEKVLTEQQEVPALGHDWDEGEVTAKAACEAAGVKTYTCKNDATHTRTEAIPALGHSFVNGVCTVCGEADPNYVAPVENNDPAPDVKTPEQQKQEEEETAAEVTGNIANNEVLSQSEVMKESVVEVRTDESGEQVVTVAITAKAQETGTPENVSMAMEASALTELNALNVDEIKVSGGGSGTVAVTLNVQELAALTENMAGANLVVDIAEKAEIEEETVAQINQTYDIVGEAVAVNMKLVAADGAETGLAGASLVIQLEIEKIDEDTVILFVDKDGNIIVTEAVWVEATEDTPAHWEVPYLGEGSYIPAVKK